MDLGLKGLRAIVTGGSKGIGRRCADILADEGAHVAVCARNAAEVEATVAALKAKGVTAYGEAVDVADKAALEAASSSWADDLKGTGVTVNVLVPGGAADTPLVPQDSPFDRATMVRPEVMMAPICWLMSEDSDGVSGMRFIGNLWDPKKPWQEASKAAGAPVAWPALADQAAARGQPLPSNRERN